MKSSTIRLSIFLSTIFITLILAVQLVWLKKVYEFEQKEFDHNVVKAIKGLYEDLEASENEPAPLNEMIRSPEPHLYIARIRVPVDTLFLRTHLQSELEGFDIFTDCYLVLYDSSQQKNIYETKLRAPTTSDDMDTRYPGKQEAYNHIALYFPHRTRYILAKMNFWIISSAILLVVLILFGGSIYYFFRQKFLNETQKDFIHNFTHEFKTPVAVISLAAEVLKKEDITQKPDKLANYAEIVSYQTKYIQGQIEKLLNFANTDSGNLHLNKQNIDLHELIRNAASSLEPLIEEKHAEIIYQLEAPRHILPADKDYITIVVINLIDNALKYSRKPRIIIHTFNENGHLVLSVKDNGVGIERKHMEKLFEKFYRVKDGDIYNTKGFGIGLTFVKKIVMAHDGKVKVESIPGVGSNFMILLPDRKT